MASRLTGLHLREISSSSHTKLEQFYHTLQVLRIASEASGELKNVRLVMRLSS